MAVPFLPSILLPFLLAPGLTKRCGRARREGSGISQTATGCQVDPSRKVSIKPICRSGTSHSERQRTSPVHPARWRPAKGDNLDFGVFALSDAASRTGRGVWTLQGVSSPCGGSSLISQAPRTGSHLFSRAVCEFSAPSLFEELDLASRDHFLAEGCSFLLTGCQFIITSVIRAGFTI